MRDFYTLVQFMDVVIPGFTLGGGCKYTRINALRPSDHVRGPADLIQQASSTIHTALENRVPVLATRAMVKSYPHIAGISSILRPASLSDMEAIGLLRGARINSENPDIDFSEIGTHASKESSNCVGPLEFCQDVQAMLQHGWRRSHTEWDRHLQDLWKKNEMSVGKVLRDM